MSKHFSTFSKPEYERDCNFCPCNVVYFALKKIQLECCCQKLGLKMAASDEIILTSNSLPFCAQVRVPTHEDGTCLFWEFATDHYDIGFGVYFEWTIAPSNTVSVHVSESSDEEEFEEEERVGELGDLLAFGELDAVWHLLCTVGELDGVAFVIIYWW